MQRKIFIILTLYIQSAALTAQQVADKRLSPEAYLEIVRKYHPVARQAALYVNQAKAALLASRGSFDPLLYLTNDQKTFDGKNYYNYSNLSLKIPTWFGIEVKAGLENNQGVYTDPQLSLDKTSYAGLSLPLAKNLLMDKRRAVLAQSKLMVSQSEAERELALNDLMFEAMDAYLQWALQFQNFRILTDAVRINEERYELIKVLVIHGDRAGVDSTEALTQLLNFRFLQNQALLDFQNSGNELSNFLWTENNQPYQLPADVLPSVVLDSANPYKAIFQPLDDMLNLARNEHPKLRSLQFKVDVLDVERRLKFQSLLPTVNLKYNALSEGYEFFKGMDAWSFENNYKFGVDVGLPLFLRQGRGDYQSAKLKLQSTQIDQDATMLAIENKVRAYYNNQVTLLQQIKTYEEALAAYQRVYDVELMRFEIGESTLFLINSRENKLLETRQKLAELKAKFFKSLYGVQWSAGTLR